MEEKKGKEKKSKDKKLKPQDMAWHCFWFKFILPVQ